MQGEKQNSLPQNEQLVPQYTNPLNTPMIKFKPTLTNLNRREYIYFNVEEFINKEEWLFPQIFAWLLPVLSQIEQANCTYIRSLSSSQELNPSYIASISFPRLLQLNLRWENLTNIQPLAFLNSPSLKQLDISSNLLINFKPLIKLNFPNLQCLYLKGNSFSHIELGKVCLDPSIQLFISIFENPDQQEVQPEDMPFLYDIKQLYMKLQGTYFAASMFHQLFLFKEYSQFFSKQSKLKLAKKVTEKFQYEHMKSEQVYQKLKKQRREFRFGQKTARRAPVTLEEYRRTL